MTADGLVWAVDDSPLQRSALSQALARAFRVEAFAGGAEVIERLVAAPPPDAVVVDWQMPEVSGLELCTFIRSRFDSAALPLLILTASGGRDEMLAGFAAGANDFVAKPFDAAELIARVSGLVRIRRMHEALKSEAEFRERFIGILGHDLRQPLNAFMIGTYALSRAGLPETHAPTVRRLKNAADRMQRMVSDLLDLTRSRAGAFPLAPRPMDLGPVILGVVEETRRAHPSRPVRFDVSGDTVGAWDGDRLSQVCTNLVGNAVEHGREGTAIEVSLEGAGESVTLCVRNEGETIPSSILASLFAPFQRGQSTSSTGLGLGLFIIDQIVRAHGGTVTVTSLEGNTCFQVNLPRRAGPLVAHGVQPPEDRETSRP